MLADGVEASVRSLVVAGRTGDPGDGHADHRRAASRRPVRRMRPDAARHRADPRGVRRRSCSACTTRASPIPQNKVVELGIAAERPAGGSGFRTTGDRGRSTAGPGGSTSRSGTGVRPPLSTRGAVSRGRPALEAGRCAVARLDRADLVGRLGARPDSTPSTWASQARRTCCRSRSCRRKPSSPARPGRDAAAGRPGRGCISAT